MRSWISEARSCGLFGCYSINSHLFLHCSHYWPTGPYCMFFFISFIIFFLFRHYLLYWDLVLYIFSKNLNKYILKDTDSLAQPRPPRHWGIVFWHWQGTLISGCSSWQEISSTSLEQKSITQSTSAEAGELRSVYGQLYPVFQNTILPTITKDWGQADKVKNTKWSCQNSNRHFFF